VPQCLQCGRCEPGTGCAVGFADAAIARLDDEAPLVRGAAIWALARLASRQQFSGFAAAGLRKERDAAVIEEWRGALAEPPAR